MFSIYCYFFFLYLSIYRIKKTCKKKILIFKENHTISYVQQSNLCLSRILRKRASTIRNQNVFHRPIRLPTAQVRTNSAVHNSVKINKVILKERAIGRWAEGGVSSRGVIPTTEAFLSRRCARAVLD